MHGSGSQCRAQRQTTVIHIPVQLESVPRLCVALGVLLDSTVTGVGQQSDRFLCRLAQLNIKTLQFGRLPDFPFGRAAFFLGNFGLLELLHRLFAANDSSGITADMANQLLAQVLFHQCIVNDNT